MGGIRVLCGQRNGPRPRKSEAEAGEHREVRVKRDPLAATGNMRDSVAIDLWRFAISPS